MQSLLEPDQQQPTRARHVLLGYLGTLTFVLYLDRVCIGKAVPSIERDLGISHDSMSWILGAFTIAYGLFEVPTGRWGDRFGSRGVLTRIVLWWSGFTMLTGCVWRFSLDSGLRLALPGEVVVPLLFDSFVLLLLIRFLFGAGEAGALPNTARVLARWFPAGQRGPAQGLINTSMLLGGAVAPIAAAHLIDWVGWRWTFVLFGLVGVVWAMAFFRWFRDDPACHPAVNLAEQRLIAGGAPLAAPPPAHAPVPWGLVLRSANVWLLGGVITCSAFASYMYFFWYPTYLEEGRAVGPLLSGWLAGLVLAGGAMGSTVGGFAADWLVRRSGSRRWSRRALGCTALALSALSLVLSVQCESAVLAGLFTALASFSASSMIATWWACVIEISGSHVGVLFGLMNSLGVPGAIASQLFFGIFADWMKDLGYVGRERWDPAFYVYAAVLLLGAIGWLFIDATRSAVEPEAIGQAFQPDA